MGDIIVRVVVIVPHYRTMESVVLCVYTEGEYIKNDTKSPANGIWRIYHYSYYAFGFGHLHRH